MLRPQCRSAEPHPQRCAVSRASLSFVLTKLPVCCWSREWNIVLDRAVPRPIFLRRGFRDARVPPDIADAAVTEVLGVAASPVRAAGSTVIHERRAGHAAVLVL